jgi:AraC-like DNA-binding protein
VCRVDAVAGLLDGPRARGAFLLRCSMDPPWAIHVRDEAPLTVMAVLRGDAWVVPGATAPVRLGTGDVVVVRGPDPYTVADDPATPPTAVIHPGQHCTTPDGTALHQSLDQGVRTWGTSPDGAAVLLTGTYPWRGDVSGRVLGALPHLLVQRADAWDSPLVGYLAEEIGRDAPGQEAVLDRLLDLLLVAVLRSWFARPDAEAPGWYRAQSDPVVGRALHLLQNDPARPWTVASLAAAVGVSRAGLARRFTALVGEPPMAYLTDWRLRLAADLLTETGATLDAVARRVGYGSGFALSSAFSRVRGESPRAHRARAGAATAVRS